VVGGNAAGGVVVVYFLSCGSESRGQSAAIFANWRRERRSARRLSLVGIQCAANVMSYRAASNGISRNGSIAGPRMERLFRPWYTAVLSVCMAMCL
jgi:hypothetical protein